MEKATIKIEGVTPLLMHQDSVEWSDAMDKWRKEAGSKKNSVAGDDRTPPYKWIGYVYHDGNVVSMPCENIMACFRDAARKIPTSRGATLKKQSQAGIQIVDSFVPLKINGKTIAVQDLEVCKNLATFEEQNKYATKLGIELFVKRVRIKNAKHIRVRPMFRNWSMEFDAVLPISAISINELKIIVEIAGQECGLGDWRPSASQPGQYGMFKATIINSKGK